MECGNIEKIALSSSSDPGNRPVATLVIAVGFESDPKQYRLKRQKVELTESEKIHLLSELRVIEILRQPMGKHYALLDPLRTQRA